MTGADISRTGKSDTPDSPAISPWGGAVLWGVLVLVCFGLGYPTLRRYDPRDPRVNFDGTNALYHWQVTGDATEVVVPPKSLLHFRYRVLVPSVARPFYLMARGRVGTWDPGYFGLLVANSLFVATTALLIVVVGAGILGDSTRAVVGALLYLLSFNVSNFLLAGLIDSGEACLLMVLVCCLYTDRWGWLPLLGVAGALAKETFVPLSVALALGWLVGSPARQRIRRLGSIAALGAMGVLTLTLLFSLGYGRFVAPWQLQRSGTVMVSLAARAWRMLGDLGLLYAFAWLLPLGVVRLGWCPPPWRTAVASATATVVALGLYNGEPGVARSLFQVLGPMLSLSVAVLLSSFISSPVGKASR